MKITVEIVATDITTAEEELKKMVKKDTFRYAEIKIRVTPPVKM